MKPNLTRWWESDWDAKAARRASEKAPRAAKQKAYLSDVREYDKAVRMCPKKMWDWSPCPGTHWSVREVIWHLADSEANFYVRFRKMAAEPGSNVMMWDQVKWDKAQGYKHLDPELGLALWGVLREANARLLKSLPKRAWGNRVRHPEYGLISLDKGVGMSSWHVRNHLAQMVRRLREWKQR